MPTDSAGFKNAPKAILDTIRRLTWAGKHAVPAGEFKEFNELLAIGYFEGMSMGVSISCANLLFQPYIPCKDADDVQVS